MCSVCFSRFFLPPPPGLGELLRSVFVARQEKEMRQDAVGLLFCISAAAGASSSSGGSVKGWARGLWGGEGNHPSPFLLPTGRC